MSVPYPCVFLPSNTVDRFSAKTRASAAKKICCVSWILRRSLRWVKSFVSWWGPVLGGRQHSPMKFSSSVFVLCSGADAPGGQWNASSAHAAPPCAFAKETVSCNDMPVSARPPPVLSLTCAHCSIHIRDDDQDGIRKRQRVKSGP